MSISLEETEKLIKELFKEWKDLQPLNPEDKKKFENKVRLEWNYNSNHIEGNTLTYGETEILLMKGREEERMAMMKLAGSEVPLQFSDSFEEMATDAAFEDRMNEKMLKQMQTSWEDIEEHEAGLGFENLSLEDFRQDLAEELQKNEQYYKDMPKGVYTGFKADRSICPVHGIIALLGYPAKLPGLLGHRYENHDLIYVDMHGKQSLLNQKEVLGALAQHKEESRSVPPAVERGEETAIEELASAIKKWLHSQAVQEEKQEDGKIKKLAGAETKDILSKLKEGDRGGVERIRQNIKASEKYQPHNFDLIVWFLVS